jgi:integrase
VLVAFTPEEARRFLEAARSDRHYLVFHLALATGMRPEEYLGLQWKEVDFEHAAVSVQRALVWSRITPGRWSLEEPKTKESRRTIPLALPLVHELRRHRDAQAELRLRTGSDFVFCSQAGTPLNLDNLRHRHFQPILKRAGLPSNVRLYDLRHTCASLLGLAGEHPQVIKERLGHATITLTLDTYSHVFPTMQRTATEKLDAILRG